MLLRNEVKPGVLSVGINGVNMNLKIHEAVSANAVFKDGLCTDKVQQLHVMVRAVLDENYAKPNPFLCMPRCDKDNKDDV